LIPVRLVAAVIVSASAACSSAPRITAPDPFDGQTWEQQQQRIPPFPARENLAGFYVSPNTSFQFFVDRKSIAIAPDGTAVRYTLVAQSSSGAMNVSYEGMRCGTHDYRVYSLGRSDGMWAQSRNPAWTPIDPFQANRAHAVLAEEVFCRGRVAPRNLDDAAKLLERRGLPFR